MTKCNGKQFVGILLLYLLQNLAYATPRGMVVSENLIASNIGAQILQAGGNAIDAACALGYALAVVNPCCGNLGGGGFMTIFTKDGKAYFINFREKAPLKSTPNLFLNGHNDIDADKLLNGYLSVAVPGTVLGLDTALQKFGSLKRADIIKPAIALALNGFVITAYEEKLFKSYANDFSKEPNVAAIFMPKGKLLKSGAILVQKDLANTLNLIANLGPDVFYHGDIAKIIVTASQAHGGILSLQDFADYSVSETAPISCTYRGYTILSSAPPSSGGITLCETLNILENFPPYDGSWKSIFYVIQALQYAFQDRNNKIGDPAYVNVPTQTLISKSYARLIAQHISPYYYHLKNYQRLLMTHELTDTTHYSIVDKFGNAVSVTYTLNGFFGARVIAANTGFFLNNEMDDFTAKVGSENKFGLLQNKNNAIQPGKCPLSSMSPTIVLKNGKVVLVIGSPGGPRIITTVLLTLLNVIDAKMSLENAAALPRFHFQGYPDNVFTEPFALNSFTRFYLETHGFHLLSQSEWGAVEAIAIDSDGKMTGVNDQRRPDGGVAIQ